MNILVNAFGISDSGGVRVLEKFLSDCRNYKNKYSYFILINDPKSYIYFIEKYSNYDAIKFKLVDHKNFFHRLYYENIIFRRLVKKYNIKLIYNFTGTGQLFLKHKQLLKIHNLLFYSRKLDFQYLRKLKIFPWLREVFLKSIIFKFFLTFSRNIEIQSTHVKNSLSRYSYININKKNFFIKSDIDVSSNEFKPIKAYDFSKKIKILFIVGPHFEYEHKNFKDFVNAMVELLKLNINFEIHITLSDDQLNNSNLWDSSLTPITRCYGYLSEAKMIEKMFCDNSILISTSIVETLGLHVIEAIKNGIISIVPDEEYCKEVYGSDLIYYELFNKRSLLNALLGIIKTPKSLSDKIKLQRKYLIENEEKKFNNVNEIFKEIENV